MLKKAWAFFLCLLMLLSFTACKKESSEDISLTEITNELISDNVTEVFAEDVGTTNNNEEAEDSTQSASDDNPIMLTTAVSVKDMSEYTKAEIAELYKNAAIKSHSSVTSQHAVEITKISINGKELGGAFDFVKGIISTFISNNSEDSKGITGGYKNLAEADINSAKIYKVGNNTAVEMVMKNQTDGAKASVQGGSVGHAIDVVGDISTVTGELTELGLPIEISSETTTVHYTNPTVKVVLDENGKIICGTWKYTVEIRLNNYKAFGADVESSMIVMDNVITVNGGFVQ